MSKRPNQGCSKLPEYNSWQAMRARCCNKNNPRYAAYGSKGIKVCPRWHVFANFRADMGPKPPGRFSIDRINGSKGYEPGNCRWATDKQQAENRPNFNRKLTDADRTQSMSAWARECGISREALKYRLDSGWNLHDAMTTPIGKSVRKDNQLQLKGVSAHGLKFKARVYGAGKHKYLGLFATAKAAARAVAQGSAT